MISKVIKFVMTRDDFDYSYYIARAANDNRLRGQSIMLDEINMRVDVEGEEENFDEFIKMFDFFPLKDKIDDLKIQEGETRNFTNFEMKKIRAQGAKKSGRSIIQFIRDIPDIFKTKLS